MNDIVSAYHNALLSSDSVRAAAIMNEYLHNKTPFEFVDEVVVKALDRIGNGWDQGEYALSQVYMSGRISEDLLESILPDESGLRKSKPKIAIALLKDYHSLGKRMVYAVLRSGGYRLIDYGRVEPDELVDSSPLFSEVKWARPGRGCLSYFLNLRPSFKTWRQLFIRS